MTPPAAGAEMHAAPHFAYRPRDPEDYHPGIGLIGCGGITKHHLNAYRQAGYDVRALSDIDRSRAEERRSQFYPGAEVYTDHRDLLDRTDIEVIDIATHPADRPALIEDALDAGKHVLSQKPFVLDLSEGERLVALAADQGVQLAVNQNGRWAPHIAYLRLAIDDGLLGDVRSVQFVVDFDHEWVVGTPFDGIADLVLYDYAIHWFDALTCYVDADATRVTATTSRAKAQTARPPLLAQVLVEYPEAQATMSFNGATRYGTIDATVVVGTDGTARSAGPSLREQTVEIETSRGLVSPHLEGSWYDDGFHGSMGELLCAIEEGRQPSHHASGNLRSLELAFAAISSAQDGGPRRPGEVRVLPQRTLP